MISSALVGPAPAHREHIGWSRRNAMRVSLIVSALFATSLFGGVALADRPGDDGGGRTRAPVIREVREARVREVREVREPRVREQQERVVREAPLRDRLRARGDMVDRTGSRAAPAP